MISNLPHLKPRFSGRLLSRVHSGSVSPYVESNARRYVRNPQLIVLFLLRTFGLALSFYITSMSALVRLYVHEPALLISDRVILLARAASVSRPLGCHSSLLLPCLAIN